MSVSGPATPEELVLFLYSDLSGLSRGRAFPLGDLEERMISGVGWVPADQALTPFDVIADPNPWGPIGDLRLVPDPATEVRVDRWPEASPLHFFLCDAVNTDGSPWDACPRVLLKGALDELEREAGLRLMAGFEQEFHLSGISRPGPAFSMEAHRVVEPLGPAVVAALAAGGLEPETFLPEFGPGQYEINCRPAMGVAAADRAAAVREVVRETARRLGYRASFTPIVDPEGVGNGVHIHFSFVDDAGNAATHDPERPGQVGEIPGRFVAGIIRHLPALVALTAPSVVSYLRLTPHRWSAGFTAFGDRNREAAVRIAPVVSIGGADPGRQFNLEYRAADAAACPHLALAAIVLAGVEGIREKLPAPPLIDTDPADLADRERERLGVRRLPGSLGEALEALEADRVARSWFPPPLLDCYLSLKRTEMRLVEDLEPSQACARYLDVY
jgi:glutamine synthetase